MTRNLKKSWFIKSWLVTAALVTAPQAFANCPLEGTWDSGYVNPRQGGAFIRITQTFDCAGNTSMRVTHLRGKMMESMAEVIDRTGTYTVGSPLAGGLLPVDIKIQSMTRRSLDPSSLALLKKAHCVDESTELLVPVDTLGKYCESMVFPDRGDMELAAVNLQGDRFFWSFFHGDEKLMIKKPGERVERRLSVDQNLPFIKQDAP